jgi:hypothetical protein
MQIFQNWQNLRSKITLIQFSSCLGIYVNEHDSNKNPYIAVFKTNDDDEKQYSLIAFEAIYKVAYSDEDISITLTILSNEVPTVKLLFNSRAEANTFRKLLYRCILQTFKTTHWFGNISGYVFGFEGNDVLPSFPQISALNSMIELIQFFYIMPEKSRKILKEAVEGSVRDKELVNTKESVVNLMTANTLTNKSTEFFKTYKANKMKLENIVSEGESSANLVNVKNEVKKLEQTLSKKKMLFSNNKDMNLLKNAIGLLEDFIDNFNVIEAYNEGSIPQKITIIQ